MPVTDSFLTFVLEQLECVAASGHITSKRMFGGVGIYAGDLFFALLSRDVLYLKTDAADREARKALEAAGARAFDPHPGQGRGTMPYYSVPAAVLEDADELARWAARAIAIALAQKSAKRTPAPKKKGRSRSA